MLTITLITDEVLHDIHTKSGIECQAYADPAERHRVEAGTEKNDELIREMKTVNSSLKRMMHRWLSESGTTADNTLSKPVSFVYNLNMTTRMSADKAQELTDACHNFMVAYTMARYYGSVGAKELSNTYSIISATAAEDVEKILNEKQPPV